jgi:hypothetical protein
VSFKANCNSAIPVARFFGSKQAKAPPDSPSQQMGEGNGSEYPPGDYPGSGAAEIGFQTVKNLAVVRFHPVPLNPKCKPKILFNHDK